jgi:POT family proton-dependent oligopeptide transporter
MNNRVEQKTYFGHPSALYMLFFTEMWERFMFYGNRALLMFFMVQSMHFDDGKANLIYGSIQALMYTVPLVGGMLADRILGQRRAIFFGGILMAAGAFTMMLQGDIFFYTGLGCIICGNGFFKPNISTMVGDLYSPDDPRRDGAFSIFYMGINIGAFLGSAICGYVGQTISWHLGFGLAGVFMLIGLFVFYRFQFLLGTTGIARGLANSETLDGAIATKVDDGNSTPLLKRKNQLGISWEWTCYITALLCVPLFVLLLINYTVMDYIMNPLALIAGVALLVFAFMETSKAAREKMLAAIVMIVFSILFWGFYEQGGGSLNLFTERNVDLEVWGIHLSSASVNNAINPLFVILFSPIFAWLWPFLNKKGLEPNTPMKFGISFLCLCFGFYLFVMGGKAANNGLVPLSYYVFGYLLLTFGELCLSPVGLSMITKLAPAKLVGMMMGAWFLASAMGQFVAGKIGAMMQVPDTNGQNQDALTSLGIYTGMFEYIAKVSAAAGVVLIILVPLLKKWLHQEK